MPFWLVILRGVGAACVAAVLSCGLPDAAHAQIPTIPLPSDVKVDPPAADVPANVSRFAGAWARGAWDGVLPHVLVVETVDGVGRAQVVYALGDYAEANVTRGYRRVTGRIVGDLLTLDLSEGTSVLYHVDGDSLRGTYMSNRRRYTVALTRAALAEVMAVPARVPGVVAGTTVRIPIAEGQNGKSDTLEATLYLPAGARPHAVLLFNHGSTGGGTVAPSITMRPSRQAQFFVERGLAVLAPMRRGRGTSRRRTPGVRRDVCARRSGRRVGARDRGRRRGNGLSSCAAMGRSQTGDCCRAVSRGHPVRRVCRGAVGDSPWCDQLRRWMDGPALRRERPRLQ